MTKMVQVQLDSGKWLEEDGWMATEKVIADSVASKSKLEVETWKY